MSYQVPQLFRVGPTENETKYFGVRQFEDTELEWAVEQFAFGIIAWCRTKEHAESIAACMNHCSNKLYRNYREKYA